MYSPEFAMAMLGASKFEWTYMFIFTLFGAILGGVVKKEPTPGFMIGVAVLMISIVAHYGFLVAITKFSVLMPIRVLMLLPITGVIYGLYLISRSEVVAHFMRNRLGKGIAFLGTLCLELYISHSWFKTTDYNRFFPLNICGYLIVVFALAYAIRCVTRLVMQTFSKDTPYDIRSIFGM